MVFAGQDHWRSHPMISKCYKNPFPGFGIALTLFVGYHLGTSALEALTNRQRKPKEIEYPPGTFKFETMPKVFYTKEQLEEMGVDVD